MNPSILEGDRIFVNKLAYDLKVPFTTWHLAQWDNPERGDVVVFYSPQDGVRLVKRVIGVPGDVIELRDNRLYVNGKPATYQPLDPEVIKQMGPAGSSFVFRAEAVTGRQHPVMEIPFVNPAVRTFGPVTVNPGECFYGAVSRDQIVGRASRVVLSLDPEHHYKPRWDRFFRQLP
jgi:signal peptidase I